MLLSNVFSDMFDDMFPMTSARAGVQNNGMMSCDVKEYADHYELDMELIASELGVTGNIHK